jgi:hypothetical protein
VTTTALALPLQELDGAPCRLGDVLDGQPHLVVVVERDCPTSVATLRALEASGARMTVVSEGRAEAAAALREEVGLSARLLVEAAPYPVSEAYELISVPTVLLLDGDGTERARVVGWDRLPIAGMAAQAGGDLSGWGEDLPETKPGCSSRNVYDEALQAQLEAADAELAPDAGQADSTEQVDDPSGSGSTWAGPAGDGIEEMWRRGWTDGLPVVPPTPERVAAMLGDRDGEEVLGEVPPVGGVLTMERLAACAVLAGCEPAYLPVVEAAVRAALEPDFNLHGIQNTTHFAAPVIIVNGPVRDRIGMNAGSNALGFGNRANATIGRALRLVMCLTGGGTAGGLDQSTLGGPHKFGLCFPEHEEASPWEPLHVTLGHAAATSTVTLVCGEGPAGVSDHYSQTPEALAATLTSALQSAWADTWYPLGAETVLILSPEHAQTFGTAGWAKADLRDWIFSHARRTVGDLRRSASGERTPFVAGAESDDVELGKFLSPDEIVIVVVGGLGGRFSAVIAPWVGFGLGSKMVTRTVEGDLP